MVDPDAGDLEAGRHPADVGRTFDDGDPVPGEGRPPGQGESGRPRPDDRDHASTVTAGCSVRVPVTA